MNTEVQTYVQQVVSDGFTSFLEQNLSSSQENHPEMPHIRTCQDAARKARDLVIRKSALESMTLRASWRIARNDPHRTELYIVEVIRRRSANRVVTVTFKPSCLCGKILNTERARPDKILANREVKALISALGTGIGEGFSLGFALWSRHYHD